MATSIDSLVGIPADVIVTTEREMICCQCGPQILAFQSQNDASKDSETILAWWENIGRHPLIIGPND